MMVMLVMVVVVPMWDVLRDRTRLSEIGCVRRWMSC